MRRALSKFHRDEATSTRTNGSPECAVLVGHELTPRYSEVCPGFLALGTPYSVRDAPFAILAIKIQQKQPVMLGITTKYRVRSAHIYVAIQPVTGIMCREDSHEHLSQTHRTGWTLPAKRVAYVT